LFPVVCVAVALAHGTLLRLPYFWDEGGYYIPAALDFFRTGTLIPQSTVTNAHPPLPAILLAGWWKVFGFHILATRLLVCIVAAAALLAVFRLAGKLLGMRAGIAVALLTAVYPIWFAQSTLAHADIFAAAFTLWALTIYLEPAGADECTPRMAKVATLFALGALAKETAIVTPLALALWEAVRLIRERRIRERRGKSVAWMATLLSPLLPLIAWYAYHHWRTGFTFGNPEFLRYNATANLGARRIVVCLWHRLIHLTLHMNMFVATLATAAILKMPAIAGRVRLHRAVLWPVGIVLAANALAFSVLGGALLTRYLLPMYPLVLLVCVGEWQSRVRQWGWIAALAGAGFLAGIWINPPYAFAPEDNLTYRDMIVLHQRAVRVLEEHFPQATVLTAWPAAAEISRADLGYLAPGATPYKFVAIPNFSLEQIEKAGTDPGAYDTALLFSTKWAPPRGKVDLGRANRSDDTKYFDFHTDLEPREVAALLHGEVVWQASRKGEWVAILRFPRIVDAELIQ
jgi:4-amino-4-deoxy-L-arabinose transferase-like glycosyltransferase